MLLAASAEWLTGFWLISVGVTIGLIVLSVLVALFKVGGLVGLSKLADSSAYVPTGVILSVAFLAAGLGLTYFWNSSSTIEGGQEQQDWVLAVFLLLPLSAFMGFGTIGMFSQRAQEQVSEWITEGVSFWLLILSGIMTLFAVIGIAGQYLPTVSFVKNPTGILHSFTRLPTVGLRPMQTFEVEPQADGFGGYPIDVNIKTKELRRVRAMSDQRLEFSTSPLNVANEEAFQQLLELPGSSEWMEYRKLPGDEIEKIYVRNMGDQTATFKMQVETQAEHPEVVAIFWTALMTVALFIAVLFQSVILPKESAISWATFKTETSQPLFAILLAVGMVFLVAAIYIPYNTFGEDIKMYVTTGRPVILLLSIFFAVWASSKSVAEEIDGRTALTVLAKPISRRQFLIGKAIGIGWSVGVLSIILGLWFLLLVSYKPIYDGVEASKGALQWQEGFIAMAKVFPALILGYMEAMVFVFISVMISTRLPIVSNLMICFAVYILGHLTPMMLEKEDAFSGVQVVGQTITTVIPVLEHFNVRAAIVGDAVVPLTYLGWTLVYSVLYCGVAMLVALILFEDRDLS